MISFENGQTYGFALGYTRFGRPFVFSDFLPATAPSNRQDAPNLPYY
jgi:hypothetical protein